MACGGKMGITLTIIIPVFNTPKDLLERCIRSIPFQDERIEVIVVDDGSCEETAKHLRMLQCEDASFRLHTQTNAGQNAARESGLKLSHGVYVLFLDSDDYLDSEAILYIIDLLAQNHPDILAYGIQYVDRAGRPITGKRRCEERYIPIETKHYLIETSALWGQIISRSLFFDPSIEFCKTCRVGEDLATLIPLLLKADTIAATNLNAYYYVQHNNSITHSQGEALSLDILLAFDFILEHIENGETYTQEIEWLAILHILYYGTFRVMGDQSAGIAARRQLSNFMRQHFPAWRQNPIFLMNVQRRGLPFWLVVTGQWRFYSLLKLLKSKLSKLKLFPVA